MASTRDVGQAAEQRASDHLIAAGLIVLERNVDVAGAELDLICEDQSDLGERTIVFVEVRSRADDRRGHPLETISANKRRHVVRAATAWLVRQQLWERVAVRFDVVTLTGDRIEWFANAFDSDA